MTRRRTRAARRIASACDLLALLTGLLLPAIGNTQTVPSAVDCAAARLDRVGKAVCNAADSAELVEWSRRIDAMTAALEQTLTGAQKNALIDTERPFLVARNNCSNSGDDAAVAACARGVLELRKRGLEAATQDAASIFAEIPRYSRVDVPFVVRYGDRLDGARVAVFGCFVLDPAPAPEQRLNGAIHEDCADPDAASVRVHFDRMDAARPNFLDKMPSSWWQGRIELQDGQPLLSMRLDDL
jgi:uncharacterized protein